MFSIEARSKGVELRYVKPLDTPHELFGDPVRLRQVLVNLVGNAIKFTDKGWVEITAKPWACPHDNQSKTCLLFEVRDSGCGIAKELQASIFDSFTQADASYSRKYQGTGLGLAICKRLVELMGGEIWVDSSPDSGSVFSFTATFDLARPVAQVKENGISVGGLKLRITSYNVCYTKLLRWTNCAPWGISDPCVFSFCSSPVSSGLQSPWTPGPRPSASCPWPVQPPRGTPSFPAWLV